MPSVLNQQPAEFHAGTPFKASTVEHLCICLMKKVKPLALLLVAQSPSGGGTATCAPFSFFYCLSIIIPRGLSSALLHHIQYKEIFVLQMDIIVLLTQNKGPYGLLRLCGHLGLTYTDCCVV
jgi:hypothetical protein